MLTFVIALAAAIAITGGIKLAFVHSTWSLLFPFLVTFFGVTITLFRRVGKKMEPIVKEAERHLMGGRRELALQSLERGLELGKWHPLMAGQVCGQIGALEYDAGKLDEAEAALRRASRWPWTSPALLGCVYFKRRDGARMNHAFELAIKAAKKEPLVYTLYAHCLIARDERTSAVAVLERALKRVPGDGRLQANLELAREGKRLKVAPYGDKWARFGLDGEGPVMPKAARGYAVRPGFRQRSRRK